MNGLRSEQQQKWLNWFLAGILLCAGVITGLKFAPVDTNDVDYQAYNIEAEITSNLDINGEWIGTLTEDYGLEARYDYRIIFDQDGDDISATMYLTMTNHEPAIYTETVVSGSVTGSTVFYAADEIRVIENAHRDQLCLAQTTLEFETVDGLDMLVGTWEGQSGQQQGCDTISGHVILTRQAE